MRSFFPHTSARIHVRNQMLGTVHTARASKHASASGPQGSSAAKRRLSLVIGVGLRISRSSSREVRIRVPFFL